MFRTCLQNSYPWLSGDWYLPSIFGYEIKSKMASVNSNRSKAFVDFTGALDIQFATVREADFNVRVNNRTRQELYLIIREYTS